uniref:Carbamoyl phosphate synthase small chain n=1 Tax=Ophidocladus simpliciusculus TaxID=1261574 RepID=A0A1Z1MJ47_9FLOR|nr:carbamoyl phosphate synthase small subunit [Ophidocladus simpliciusculus]ARW65909.1 carbamoyl phosphate synthase small subunit [Ophidocladus simpliciusculus]
MSNTIYPASLCLQDGTIYQGLSLFQLSAYHGEIVFNTGMTGYQEVFSDPSYSGQMVLFTYPEIGNTGLNKEDNESNFIHIKALITKNISLLSSNWRSKISLKDYIILKRIPHIFGIDTRSLTKRLRIYGVTNGILSGFNFQFDINNLNFNSVGSLDLVRRVTTRQKYSLSYSNYVNYFVYNNYLLKNNKKLFSPCKIVVMDFGLKFNILRILLSLGCDVFVLPATCSYETILSYQPDGLLLSNGPGNPSSVTYAINTLKKFILFANIPIFGICMGHQVLNLALGAQTFKLKFGHRGLNHPSGLKDYSMITSQNHGFAVDEKSLFKNALIKELKIKYFNLNDLTVSSTLHNYRPIFSVQYHPEASPGPHDSDYLFKIFIQLIKYSK